MATQETTSPNPSASASATVAKVVEVLGVHLASLDAKAWVPPSEILSGDVTWNIGRRTSYNFDEESKGLSVFLEASTSGVRPPAGNEEETAGSAVTPLVTITAVFVVEYQLVVDPPPADRRDKFFGSFAEINGTVNAWPYVRELVQNTLVRMNLPPITVPLYRAEDRWKTEAIRELPPPSPTDPRGHDA